MDEHALEVHCTGMAPGTPPDPCVIVICGVAGDLSRTTLIPSLYALACQQLLPEPCAILGVGHRPWNDDAFRQEMRSFVQDRKDFSPEAWVQFATRLHFVAGDFSAPASEVYAILQTQIAQVQRAHHIPDGSCWIPGSYTPCTGLKHLILQGFFQRCRIGHDPRVKPVQTICYDKLDR
jgi:hypothetical protein